MSEFKTPGVYVEEVTKFPPSVAQVETAIPAFIGYTELAIDEAAKNLRLTPKRITSLLEYETYFGKANKESIILQDTVDKGLTLVKPEVNFLMYYSLQMYFANGGGPCYIMSVGDYTAGVTKDKLKEGLDLVKKEDEPTLILFPDAVSLEEEDFYAIYQEALHQANDLKDRFVILDTYLGDSKSEPGEPNTIGYFRENIEPSRYGAAYFPHLKTILNYAFDEKETKIQHKGLQRSNDSNPFFIAAIQELTTLESKATPGASQELLGNILTQAVTAIETVNRTADQEINVETVNQLLSNTNQGTVISSDSVLSALSALKALLQTAEDKTGIAHDKTLEDLRLSNSGLYNQIRKEMASLAVVLPPSSAMAGVYARVDSTKGVWKAPANVGLNYVIAPTEKISNEAQESLNVDTVAGKSINAIRSFTGKGTLVWGARTLDGNSNEWRYISVRRFFNMAEESIKKATERFVFESNDAKTWVRVQAMITNFLTDQWKSGALAGSTPEEAFYVAVGLNQTMSAQDINEGRMNIEIGMAAVRPAEFIVLRFSHKLQES